MRDYTDGNCFSINIMHCIVVQKGGRIEVSANSIGAKIRIFHRNVSFIDLEFLGRLRANGHSSRDLI